MTSLDKIAGKVARELGSGEVVVAGCRVIPEGTGTEFVYRATRRVGHGPGAWVNRRMQERQLGDLPQREQGAAASAGFPLAPELVLVLTDRRLMVWGIRTFTGAPRELLGSIDLAAISGADRGDGLLVRAKVGKLTLRFAGGEELGLLVARPFTTLLDQLASELEQRIAR